MNRKWKPNATQRRQFRKNMEDPEFAAAYYERKKQREDKRHEKSQFDYNNAGGMYVPTAEQNRIAFEMLYNGNLTVEQEDAANMVTYGFTCKQKIAHDYIHIVNEYQRNKNI